MKRSLIQNCLRTARDQLTSHPQRRFLHWSFLYCEGKLLSIGVNLTHDPPIHWGYRKPEIGRPGAKLHAEVVAYKRAKGLLRGRTFSLVNIRLNRLGQLRRSYACQCCRSLLQELGCREFISIGESDDTSL